MAKFLQEHSKPVTQGLISSAIFQVLWNGGSALIGWIAGHYAALRGLALHWAILIGAVVFFLLALSYNLIWRKRQSTASQPKSELPPSAQAENTLVRELQTQIAELKSTISKASLTFEIDTENTQVAIQGSDGGKCIRANVKLRCFNASAGVMAVREFQASLHKDGELIIGKVNAKTAWLMPMTSTKPEIDISNGITVSDPISPYYWFFFYLNLPPRVGGRLSGDHFIRITMNAVGEESQTIDFYVDSWGDARQSNSSVTLKTTTSLSESQSNDDCPEMWLHTIAEYEKNAIDTRLRVIEGHIWKARFDEQPYEIEFNFDVVNSAVYPVTFKDIASTARIKFAHKALLYPPTIQLSADAYLHGNGGWFHLTQQLTEGEYERYKNADGQCAFEFHKLKLEIKGTNGFEDVVESRFLRIPFIITKADERFLARG